MNELEKLIGRIQAIAYGNVETKQDDVFQLNMKLALEVENVNNRLRQCNTLLH